MASLENVPVEIIPHQLSASEAWQRMMEKGVYRDYMRMSDGEITDLKRRIEEGGELNEKEQLIANYLRATGVGRN